MGGLLQSAARLNYTFTAGPVEDELRVFGEETSPQTPTIPRRSP